jgi:hypothetical protein
MMNIPDIDIHDISMKMTTSNGFKCRVIASIASNANVTLMGHEVVRTVELTETCSVSG